MLNRLAFLAVPAAVTLLTAVSTVAAWADSFVFSTGNPDGKLGALTRPGVPGKIETETADDFVLSETTAIRQAVITGLIVPAVPLVSISQVEVELYHVFPLDSDTARTFNVPTRTNSPADVEIGNATRDSFANTLGFSSTLMTGTFTVTNSVVNDISVKTGGEGSMTGEEVAISISFTTPLILPAGHYFFRPEVLVTGGNFLYLSAPRPIVSPGTPFPAGTTDLQAWIRNATLAPDWLRIGTDIVDGTPAPTFNMTFSLAGDTVPEAGTPGAPNCHGQTVSALAHQFMGMKGASLALGASSLDALQNAIDLYCTGPGPAPLTP